MKRKKILLLVLIVIVFTAVVFTVGYYLTKNSELEQMEEFLIQNPKNVELDDLESEYKIFFHEGQCKVLLTDKREVLELKDFKVSNGDCPDLVRSGNSIVYRVTLPPIDTTKFGATSFKESSDLNFYNISDKKLYEFYRGEEDNENLDTVVLDGINNRILLLAKNNAVLYEIQKEPVLKEAINFKDEFAKNKLLNMDYKTYFRVSSEFESIFTLGKLEKNDQTITFTYPATLKFDKEYIYQIVVNTETESYAEILESAN